MLILQHLQSCAVHKIRKKTLKSLPQGPDLWRTNGEKNSILLNNGKNFLDFHCWITGSASETTRFCQTHLVHSFSSSPSFVSSHEWGDSPPKKNFPISVTHFFYKMSLRISVRERDGNSFFPSTPWKAPQSHFRFSSVEHKKMGILSISLNEREKKLTIIVVTTIHMNQNLIFLFSFSSSRVYF